MYSHDYASTGFSKLSEITPKNISNLRQVCSYPLPEATTFESSLVEVNGTLYFTSSEYTYAIDAGDCRLKWRCSPFRKRTTGTGRRSAPSPGTAHSPRFFSGSSPPI